MKLEIKLFTQNKKKIRNTQKILKNHKKNPIFGPLKTGKYPPFLAGLTRTKNPVFGKIPSGGKAPLRHPLKSGFLRFFAKFSEILQKNLKKSGKPRKPPKTGIV